MKSTIAESITIRVGHGIMTIPRDPGKSSCSEECKRNNKEKKDHN